MAEVFLGAFLQLLLDRLTLRDYFLSCFARVHGVEKTLKRWADKLCGIQSVLQDAEEKQLTAGAVKQWLDDLKDLAYDIEDILDSFYTDLLRRRVNKQNRAGICKVRALFPRVNFNFNLNTNVEEVSVRLQDISERKDRLGLIYIASSSSSTRAWQRPPSSSVVDGALVGRDSDKRKIVGLLSRDGVSPVNFHVVAIVGMGGLGKTTLAGHVFNDDAINEFDIKVWVSVSHNFDIVRVTKAILESVTSVHCALEEFSKVQENLSKELTSKKFLIVLDDVWNTCDYDLWTKLQSPFPVGATGSKIIVTTRDAEVAKMMRAIEIHNLELMSNDDCWKLFEQHAFSDLSTLRQPNFESYKEKVVVKCAGLPLAARTLGGLLGCKEIGDWQEILDNKLWTSDDNGILPVLKLSYHYLPSRVKRCFAYCSILPTDYEFGKKSLILLWMAEGLIQVSQERKKMEDVGGDYFGELLSRSLLQKSSKNDSLYVMHDLVSDLARSVAGETCFRLEDRSDGGCSRKTRHSSYIPGDYDGIKKFEEFSKAERLRTFLPLSISHNPLGNHLSRNIAFDLVPKLECLRLLSLNGYKIIELPKSIGRLKHIRYLNLSHTLIKSLPKSVCTLYNLQTLILENCSCLQTLPKNIRNLSDLRHLINSNVPLLEGMPVQLGRLTNLQTLSTFVVGVGNHSRIREIGPLSHLQGKICLLQLENVNNVQDARMVDLESKKGLDAVLLEWGSTRENESKVLDILKPHRKLKEITIVGYGGLKFSSWIGHPSFADITVVRLKNCRSCPFLPLLGQLPSLKELYIAGMSKVKTVGIEFYGESSLPFPQLEILDFRDMHGWKEWFPCEADEAAQVFAHLKMLSIYNCPKLEGKLPDNIPLLSKLVINGCEKLVVTVSNYKSLSELLIDNCKVVVHSDAAEFERLKDLQLSNTSKFELQVEAFMRGVSKVESLEISGCEGLTSSWLNKSELLQHLISLCSLTIRGNSHSYFQFVQALTSLQELKIYGCPNLVSFPDAGFPTSVNKLWIHGCSSLEYIVRYQMPPSLRILTIRNCENLKSLIEKVEEVGSSSPLSLMQQEASSLEYFDIDNCPSLVSLSFGRCFPKALKQLLIDSCEKLESISNPFSNSTSLEEIVIWRCQNFKSLPEGLYDLINLHTLAIWDCASLVAVPRSASQSLQNLNSLQKLYLDYRQGFTSSLREGFPPNLIQLSIWDLESCEPLLFEWGLHRLTSLRVLTISVSGEDPELVSFPPENDEETQMLLPKSLVRLSLCAFPNLSKLSKGLQFLTSLQSLDLWHCPKLACLPEEGLPYSLTQLYIHGCPLLEERCKAGYIGRNAYWSSIAHIPYIELEDWKNTDSPS